MRIEAETPLPIDGGYQRPSFLMGLPSLGTVSLKFCIAFARLQLPVNSVAQSLPVEGAEVAEARNFIAQTYLGMNPRPKYLFFLGDDMLPPWDGLVRLWMEMETGRWDVLTGLYYMKTEPPLPLTWRSGVPGPLQPGVHYQLGETIPVDVTGLDFTLIKPEILERVEKPWFKTGIKFAPVNDKGDGNITVHTEDTYFLEKVRDAGGTIGVCTSVRVGHYSAADGMIY